jgi:thiamine-monophosphate kinase
VIDAIMEADLIRWLRRRLPPHPLLQVGPGDDAAVLRLSTEAGIVVTTDLLTDGVDFRLSEIDARRAGRKALAVNLSDLAAMAARPVAAVVALALPRTGGGQLARQLFEGMLPLAEKYNVALAGGDTNAWDGPLVVSITALGNTTGRGPLLRSGAKPGDEIVVSGQFGGSILGKHLDFEPRVNEAILLHANFQLHAGIDVSDGLSVDLAHLAEESHCGVEIDPDAIPLSAAAERLAAAAAGRTAVDHALGDGEDFELILALPPEEARRLLLEQPLQGVPLTRIGRCLAEPGLWQQSADGSRRPLPISGWQHEFDD